MTNGFMNDLRWEVKFGLPMVRKQWTFFPKKMTSGKWVWWDEYYVEESFGNADPRHMVIRSTYYSKEEWFIKKLADD